MKTRLLFLLVTACCLMAFSQINIGGVWSGNIAMPNGNDSATLSYTLKQTNNTLSGSITGPDGGIVPIDSGSVAGNNYSFTITEPYGQAKISGTYYGDSLSSNISLPNGTLLHMRMLRSK